MRRRMLPLSAAVVCALAFGGALESILHGQAGPRVSAGGVLAIKGGTVLTVTKGVIPNGTVLVRNGKIVDVGAQVTIPAGAEVVDATGRFVSPGLIDCHSHIAADSINEGGTTVSSMTGIEDVFNPTDMNIYRDLAGGLTVANVLHGSANPIGGKNQVIKLRWGKTRAEDFVFEGAMPGIKFALGENPKDLGPGQQGAPRRYPLTRPGVEFVIRDAFTRAKAYQKEWQEYRTRKAAGQTPLVRAASRPAEALGEGGEDVLEPRRNLQLDPLVEILEGKRLVHAHSYRADEILMLIRLAEEVGFKVATFQHVLEGYKVAKELAAHGAGASTFSDWWGYKIEAIDAIPYNAALMTRKGVVVSINSDSAEHARRLNTEAAKSIKWGGLSEAEALALVTINPAKQLRIDNRVGSLESGKDADLVIWTRHPLSSYAIVDRSYIDGILYYDRQAEERRLTELKQEKDTLVMAERAERRSPATTDQNQEKPRTASPGALSGDRISAPGPSSDENAMSVGTAGAAPPLRAAVAGGVAPERALRNAQSRPAGGPVLAITNARIVPVTRPEIERGTILIRNGRIDAVGTDVQVPAGAKVIDAAGASVYPGWIDARSTVGLSEPGARGFADDQEMLEFNPQLRTQVAFHSDSDAIPIARANGVTTVAVTPAGGMLGGQVAVMNLSGWTWEENTVAPNVGIAFDFPAIGGGGRGGGGFGQAPDRTRQYDDLKKERDAKLDALVRLFDQARAYAKVPAASRTVDWTLDALVPVVERRLPLIARAEREQEIRDVVAFAERANVKLVIGGGLEAPLVAPLLKEKNIPVVLSSILTLPSREDMSHAASYQVASELERAGVLFAFSSGGNTNARLLPYNAAQSVAWGLSRDEAIKALTINAAAILGVGDRLGSIEPGKIANLVVSKGDPLEIRTEVTHVIINGQDVGLANRHRALYERYMTRQ